MKNKFNQLIFIYFFNNSICRNSNYNFMIKKFSLVFILLILANCQMSMMQKKDFDLDPKEIRKIAAFKINYTYKGKKIDIKEPSFCRLYFANNQFFDVESKDAKNHKFKDNYVFVKNLNYSNGVYLAKASCLHYKFLYNLAVVKDINEKLFTFPKDKNEDIYYVGDFDIDWNPNEGEGVKIYGSSLGNYPNMENAKGALNIKSHREFKKFSEFMKNNFPDVKFVDASQNTAINVKK